MIRMSVQKSAACGVYFEKVKVFFFFGVGRQDEHKADYEVPSVEAYREATD